jgi:hypothetical protein
MFKGLLILHLRVTEKERKKKRKGQKGKLSKLSQISKTVGIVLDWIKYQNYISG